MMVCFSDLSVNDMPTFDAVLMGKIKENNLRLESRTEIRDGIKMNRNTV